MRLSSITVALMVILFAGIVGCDESGQVTGPESAELDIIMNIFGTSISTIVAEVTASDIDPAVVDTLEIQGDTAKGTLTIPAGSDRTITLRAFDASDIETHRGAATISIEPGSNQDVQITLQALTGEVSVTGVIAFGVPVARPALPEMQVPFEALSPWHVERV